MKKVGIVGTGIAALSCAYALKDSCQITFFEKDPRPGGHSNTVFVDEDGQQIPIDTGFIVYNEVTYPGLVQFFKELQIPTQPTSMSFSFQHRPSGLEYCGAGMSGLFVQRRNLFSLRFWKMLSDINRFNQTGAEILDDPRYEGKTIREYAAEKNLGADFLERFILPMSSAIWSTDAPLMLDFPAATLVRFFKNHGLMGLTTHYQWRTVTGGSRVYRDKVLAFFKDSVYLGEGALRVRREGVGASVETARGRHEFDAVVLACHADQALELLAAPSEDEKKLLSVFRYQKNHATLHTDETLMPDRKSAWSSWNYLVPKGGGAPSCVYWMTGLQRMSKKNYFVSINDPGLIDPKKILWQADYEHPVYNPQTIDAQKKLPNLNRMPLFFCGSYFKYGFHEDAFQAGKEAANALLAL